MPLAEAPTGPDRRLTRGRSRTAGFGVGVVLRGGGGGRYDDEDDPPT